MSGARDTVAQEARGEAYTIFSDLSEVTGGAGGTRPGGAEEQGGAGGGSRLPGPAPSTLSAPTGAPPPPPPPAVGRAAGGAGGQHQGGAGPPHREGGVLRADLRRQVNPGERPAGGGGAAHGPWTHHQLFHTDSGGLGGIQHNICEGNKLVKIMTKSCIRARATPRPPCWRPWGRAGRSPPRPWPASLAWPAPSAPRASSQAPSPCSAGRAPAAASWRTM